MTIVLLRPYHILTTWFGLIGCDFIVVVHPLFTVKHKVIKYIYYKNTVAPLAVQKISFGGWWRPKQSEMLICLLDL